MPRSSCSASVALGLTIRPRASVLTRGPVHLVPSQDPVSVSGSFLDCQTWIPITEHSKG
ncbi:hva22 tb2 dp1 family protein, partial [Moniliophthora roreri]